jgi:hypothetical protein
MASASTAPVVEDITEVNRKFFKYLYPIPNKIPQLVANQSIRISSEQAENYNSVSHQEVIQIVGDELLKRKEWSEVAWDEDNTRLLDYACGTGLISKVCFPNLQ